MTHPYPATAHAETIEARVERKLLDQYSASTFKVSFVEYPVIGVMAALFTVRTGSGLAIAWAAMAMLLVALRIGVKRYCLESPLVDARGERRWRRIVAALSLLNGAIYGVCGVLFFSPDDIVVTGFLCIVFAGFLASTVLVLAPLPRNYDLFAGAVILPFALRSLIEGGHLFTSLGLLAGATFVVSALACRNTHKALRESLRLRFENLDLVEQLRRETDVSQAARHEAEQANAAKSRFLAAASHDLRQPAHAQGLFLEALVRTTLNTEQRELLDSARAAATASAGMLDTLLDFSRIEAGVIEPQLRPFRLLTLFNKIEREFAPQADAKGLVYRSRETPVVVHSDPALVELIVRNLVSNAIRYTERGGVLVACRRHGARATIEVWDTGIGIAAEHRREVFREFQQIGNPERDRRKGLGLGLAIADGLARQLGHDLSLSSVPKRGSVFRLTLPTSDAAPAACVDAAPDEARLRGVRVLLIDDDAAVLAGTARLLAEWGCLCDAAESIDEALTLARLHAPDAIISDYRLRGRRTGAEAIAAVRALLGHALPALLITGDTAPDRLREARASGVPLLHKPVPAERLCRALAEALRT